MSEDHEMKLVSKSDSGNLWNYLGDQVVRYNEEEAKQAQVLNAREIEWMLSHRSEGRSLSDSYEVLGRVLLHPDVVAAMQVRTQVNLKGAFDDLQKDQPQWPTDVQQLTRLVVALRWIEDDFMSVKDWDRDVKMTDCLRLVVFELLEGLTNFYGPSDRYAPLVRACTISNQLLSFPVMEDVDDDSEDVSEPMTGKRSREEMNMQSALEREPGEAIPFREVADFLKLPLQRLAGKPLEYVTCEVYRGIIEVLVFRMGAGFREKWLTFVNKVMGSPLRIHNWDLEFRDVFGELGVRLLATKFGHWMKDKMEYLRELYYDEASRRYRMNNTQDRIDKDRRYLQENAPFKMLKVFGLSGEVSSFLWHLECKLRRWSYDPSVHPTGDLLHIPPHVKVLVNLVLSIGDNRTEGTEVFPVDGWKFATIHRLLSNLYQPHDVCFRKLRSACYRKDGNAQLVLQDNTLAPLTVLAAQKGQRSFFDIIQELQSEKHTQTLDLEPLRIDKRRPVELSAKLDSDQQRRQRANVFRVTVSGYYASKFERTGGVVASQSYADSHKSLMEAAKADLQRWEQRAKAKKDRLKVTQDKAVLVQMVSDLLRVMMCGVLTPKGDEWMALLVSVAKKCGLPMDESELSVTVELWKDGVENDPTHGEAVKAFNKLVPTLAGPLVNGGVAHRIKALCMRWTYGYKFAQNVPMMMMKKSFKTLLEEYWQLKAGQASSKNVSPTKAEKDQEESEYLQSILMAHGAAPTSAEVMAGPNVRPGVDLSGVQPLATALVIVFQQDFQWAFGKVNFDHQERGQKRGAYSR